MLDRLDKARLEEAERDMEIKEADFLSAEARLIHVVFQLNRTINTLTDRLAALEERTPQ